MAVFGFDDKTTHVGFADEAYWDNKDVDFRSIACVSARIKDYCEIESRLYAARCRAGAKMLELKWSEDGKETKRSEGERKLDTEFIFKAALELALEQKLRIDVVIWDKEDRKTLEQQLNIREMSDVQYLQFMYQVLITDIIKRWRSSEDVSSHYWSIAPDQHSGLKFSSLQRQVQSDVIPENGGQTVVEILDEKCAPNYSLQLVDVFAGLGAFSHIHWNRYGTWLEQDEQIRSGFSATQALLRFPLLKLLVKQCSVNNFGVTILKPVPNFRGRGLWTREPSKLEHPINFWCYTL